jgi:hypothetical protein
MTVTQFLGVVLLSLPFVGTAAYGAHLIGWKATGLIFGSIALMAVLFGAGIYLIGGPIVTPGC